MKFAPILLLVVVVCSSSFLMSQEEGETSLGDVARQLRQAKASTSGAQSVIDNDNLPHVMEESATHHGSGLMFSFDGEGKNFQVSTSPDVTCSLSFNASSASLLTSMYVAQNLPERELLKLDGPATMQGNSLRLMVYNGTQWNLREITIGITIVKRSRPDASSLVGNTSADPSSTEIGGSGERRPDVTVLYHVKGNAAPSKTTLFQAPIVSAIAPGQEWHWAIVEAKGIPPQPTSIDQAGN